MDIFAFVAELKSCDCSAGVLSTDFLIQFLERIIHPVTRLSTHTDLMNFMALSDVSGCHYVSC